MITCPNCGAGNKPGSSSCRMCATSLDGIVETQAARASASKQDSHGHEEAKPPVEQEGIVCAECGTMNEPGWSFCQQCGKRLAKPTTPPPSPQPPAGIPADLRTVAEQHAVIDPMVQGLRTNPEPQPAESYKTVVAQPPPIEEPKVAPKHPVPAAPPTVVAQPPFVEPKPSTPDLSSARNAPAEAPLPPKPTAPTPALPVQEKPAGPTPPQAAKPSTPPPAPREPFVETAGSVSGALCNQCGQSNTAGSAFCASCGAPLTFGKTMVISSQSAPPKGSLHLVMEGGQPGEVYDLENETVIGRTNGAITFPHDGFMSGRHARIQQKGGSFTLTDEGSRNGTFIKIKDEVELQPGDMILVGKQLFRFEVKE